ncbi:MAG: site-specific integrase [Bdellovibrionales bacterium]|nr:site-specific integrase [Bdellovibrionales bacterium]
MIQTYQTADGETRYRVRVFVRSGKNPNLRITEQKGSIETLQEAHEVEKKLRRVCEDQVKEIESRGILWDDLLNEWDKTERRLKVATGQRQLINHEDYLGALRKWTKDYLQKPSMDLNQFVLVSIFEKMKEAGLCLGYRKKLKQIFKSVFDFGIHSRLLTHIHRSPTFEVVLKRGEEKQPEILTFQEIQALIQKANEQDHPWKRIWHIALLTGMRSGELYALAWQDVDFENMTINVHRSYNCRLRSFKSTKAGTWRKVPISPELKQLLLEQRKLTGTGPQVFSRDTQWDKGLQAKILRTFCTMNGLPSIKFHTLRACFATQMLRQGVEAAKVMKICGWKELKTMQHYVRLAGIEIQGITDRLRFFENTDESSLNVTGLRHVSDTRF